MVSPPHKANPNPNLNPNPNSNRRSALHIKRILEKYEVVGNKQELEQAGAVQDLEVQDLEGRKRGDGGLEEEEEAKPSPNPSPNPAAEHSLLVAVDHFRAQRLHQAVSKFDEAIIFGSERL